jgi:AraC family transcriptional regulator of adaptative response / DNA-3-methyladenine glycosylase II
VDRFLEHYHVTPADFLVRARLDAAKGKLLATTGTIQGIAQEVGFADAKEFRSLFERRNGMAPEAYRDLAKASSFLLRLPEGYPFASLRQALGRDMHSFTERLADDRYVTGINLSDGPRLVTMVLSGAAATISISPATKEAARVHAMVVGLFGLDQDTDAFEKLAKRRGVGHLVACAGLRVHQSHTVYDGLLWTVIGQQINIPFACRLRQRITELAGTSIRDGLYAPPTPQRIAVLKPEQLLPLQYSRQKADYIVSMARLIADGKLDLEKLRASSATRARRTLLGVKGLGVWSVNYLMMRALGFADCLPVGDTGVTSGLQRVLKLKERPDAAATLRLSAQFAPFRSLATAHLWWSGN